MKKTNKIAGIILLMFMLMQFMTTVVCAENLAPQNVRWATEKEHRTCQTGLSGIMLTVTILIFFMNIRTANCL